MNAYELADEVERLYQQDCIDGVADLSMPESANMLRQQADRIAELEKKLFMQEAREAFFPQTKPLSDEEIAVIWANHSVPMTGMEFLKVARAILKAQNG